jgi:hypothetical protein
MCFGLSVMLCLSWLLLAIAPYCLFFVQIVAVACLLISPRLGSVYFFLGCALPVPSLLEDMNFSDSGKP